MVAKREGSREVRAAGESLNMLDSVG